MVRRGGVLSALVLLLLLGIGSEALAKNTALGTSSVHIRPGAPKGFEVLEQPQIGSADVYYGGKQIAQALIRFTPETIQFENVEEILVKIPSIKKENFDKIKQALSGSISTHAAEVCPPLSANLTREDCGRLTPDIAGVIFNESAFKAEIFINSSYLDKQDLINDERLPPATTGFSGVHSFSGFLTQENGGNNSVSIAQDSTLGYKSGRFNLVNNYTENDARVDRALFSLDRNGLLYKGGLFENLSHRILPQLQVAGASIGTSLDTNLVYKRNAGNQIWLYLPVRSWVTLLHNNIIYATEFYEAGNQIIDTTALPEGAYDLVLRIREPNGVTRDERRFFAKNFQLPPTDKPIYYGMVGMVRKQNQNTTLPEISSKPIIQGDMIRRINEYLGLSVTAIGMDDTAYTEAGLFALLKPNQRIGAGIMVSSKGDYGVSGNYQSSWFDSKVSVSVDVRKIWAQDDYTTLVLDDTQHLINGDSFQATALATYQVLDNVSLNVQANFSNNEGSPDTYAYGPFVRWSVWRQGENDLSFYSDLNETQDGLDYSTFLRLTLRFGVMGYIAEGGVTRSSSTTTSTSHIDHSPYGYARVSYNQDKDPSKLLVIGAETRVERDYNQEQVDLDYRGKLGRVRLLAQENNTNNTHNTYYNEIFGFSIAHTADKIAWGGDHQETSGLMITPVGEVKDSSFKVMINGTERTNASTQRSTLLMLPPYETYRVSLLPKTNNGVEYDATSRFITLYPGNVENMKWDIHPIVVIIATVVDEAGKPLVGARLQDARNITVSDENGNFQAEMMNPQSLTFTTSVSDDDSESFDEETCHVTLPVQEPTNGVIIYQDNLKCIR